MLPPGRIGNKIKAIFFDLDGTLIDSTNQIIEAISRTRVEKGFLRENPSQIESKIGLHARELFSDLNLDAIDEEAAVYIFRKHLKRIELDESDLYPGVNEFLIWARENNFVMAVATNKPKTLAVKALQETGIVDFFELIQGADDLPTKPNPAIIIKCLEFLKMTGDEVCMIGDRVEDILAAKASGVRAFGLVQGSHTTEDHFESGAEKTFENFDSLLEFAQLGGFR